MGSGEQGEVTVENGSTSEQSAMETSNEETDNKVKNYRMAQPTQWVPAILDYMKKARSHISTCLA